MEKIYDVAKRNWIFVVFIVVVLLVFSRRYNYLTASVVSFPDDQIVFSIQEETIEQTWQPSAKMISGVSLPFYAEKSFTADIELTIYSDDYSQVLHQQTITGYEFAGGESGNVMFDFQRTKVVQGERYRFVFRFINPSADGAICIPSGSNYGGCRIGETQIEEAVALSVEIVKYSKIFWLIAVIFPVLGITFFCMMFWDKKWEQCVGVSVFFEGIVLYLFGWFEHLEWGIIGVYILSGIGLCLGIWLYNKQEKSIKDIMTPGLWIYFIFFVIIILATSGDWLGNRDELRHWGIVVHDMFYYDSFAKHAGTTVILPRYLPFTALVEYLFVYMNGLFGEDLLLIAYQVMLLSVLILVCEPLSKKGGWKYCFPVFVSLLVIPILFFNNISNCIMVDSLQAVVMAYILICYYTEGLHSFNVFRIGMALISLVLIKDIGLVFGGMMLLIIGGDIVATQVKERMFNIHKLLYPFVGLLLIVGVYVSWQVYLNIPVQSASNSVMVVQAKEESAGLSDQEIEETTDGKTSSQNEVEVEDALTASSFSIDRLLAILSGNGENYQKEATKNLVVELFDGEMYSFMSVKLSFVDLLTIIAFMVLSLGCLNCWKADKIRIYMFTVTVFLAGACLGAFLLVAYWFIFGRYEALTSLSRYLSPYLCALFITLVYFVIVSCRLSNDDMKCRYLLYGICASLLISMPVSGIVEESKDVENGATEKNTYGHDRLEDILRSVAKRGERAYFVCSNSDGFSEYLFRNRVCPIISEHENWNIVANDELFERQKDLYGDTLTVHNTAVVMSQQKWVEQLDECEYVVVFHADELFKESYAEVFGNSENIQDGSVYRVEKDNGEINLAMIGQTGIKGWR